MRNTSCLAAAILGAAVLISSCGGSPAGNQEKAAAETSTAAGAGPQPSPSSTYGFADYDFYEVDRGACVGIESLEAKTAVTLDIHQPKSLVGEFFYPNCLTNVRRDELTVKVTNNGRTTHNFIVEGDDVELVVHPGDSGKVDVTLGPGGEIGFQCTIHQRFMFGAFFRKNV